MHFGSLTFWQLVPIFHKWFYEGTNTRVIKYQQFTGKLVKGNWSGSWSIQLLADSWAL